MTEVKTVIKLRLRTKSGMTAYLGEAKDFSPVEIGRVIQSCPIALKVGDSFEIIERKEEVG